MSRARAAGRKLAKGLGTTVLGGGVGAIGYALHGLSSKLTAPNGDMTKYPSRFWIPGVAMLAAGHFMHRRPRLANAGIALCGAAGFSIAEGATLAYTIKQNQKTQAASSGATTQGLSEGPGNLPSYYETGAVMGPSDTGALLNGADVGEVYSVDSELAPAMAM
jgi:hypothetical protein